MRQKYYRRSRKPGLLDAMAKLPWWGAALTGYAGAVAFWYLGPKLTIPGAASNAALWSLNNALHQSGLFKLLGWLAFGAGVLAAVASWQASAKRKRLLDQQQGLDSIRAMSWQDFELLVGECYRRQGYTVTENGQGGADGGIDLILHRGGVKMLVQCKQWKSSSVGAPIIREMYGLMAHHKAGRVAVVTCGHFTRDAWAFAKGKPIDLIGGERLLTLVKSLQSNE